MRKTEIMKKVNTSISKIGFEIRKHSPEILVVAGTVGVIVSAVTACKVTTKVQDILDETKETVDTVHKCAEDETLKEEYTEDDAKKDLAIVYIQTGVKLVKLYAPSVILGAVSLTAILASNNILKKRNAALAAAYAAVDKGFKEYRLKVIDRFGEEVDKELKYNIKAKKVEEDVTDPETGKTKKVKKTEKVSELDTCSPYAKFFDASSREWEKDPEYNLMFLRAQQQYANDIFRSRGHLFLNEVYDMLDIPRTKEGQIVGWVYDEENPVGDNFVDFGIYETNRANQNFVNGYEPVILLDFNVDGNIWELMK